MFLYPAYPYDLKATVSGKLVSAPPLASNLAPARILSLLSLLRAFLELKQVSH